MDVNSLSVVRLNNEIKYKNCICKRSCRVRRVWIRPSSKSVNLFSFYLLLPAFLDTGLPIGNGYERDSYVPCQVPSLPNLTTRRVWPHHRSLRPLLFSNSSVGSFTSHMNRSVKVLRDGTYSFSSLSEKTRKSNHLQMSLQRQHFLLSYLKTLSVSPVGV